jgi:Tfp pilus assembly protein PilF
MRTCIIILLVIISLGSYAQAEDSASILINQGIALHDKGDYEGAIRLYDEVIGKDPNNYLALYEKSLSLYYSGKYQECVDLSKQLLRQFPNGKDNAKVHVNYGSALDALGKPDDAIVVYTEGIKKFPGSYLLYFNRGITEMAQKETAKATEDFKRSVSLNPHHASSHQYLGYCMYYKNKVAAMMSLMTFLMLEPEGQRAQKNLKALLELLGSNVEKKDDKNITISLTMDAAKPKRNKEDDFQMTELTLSMQQALFLGDKKDLSPAQKLKETLEVIAVIDPGKKNKKKGFFTKFYVPFFNKMFADSSMLETASYIMHSSGNNVEISEWLRQNKPRVEAFYKALEEYRWIKED